MCGVGFVADLTGRSSHQTLERGLVALMRLTHRGAPAATASIDGAGVLTAIPWSLLEDDLPRGGAASTRLVGAFFVPSGAAPVALPLIERELRRAGWPTVVWRPVPVSAGALAPHLRSGAPRLYQALAVAGADVGDADRRLFRARRRIEYRAARRGLAGFAVLSLSTTTVVYKGLLTPEQLPIYFADLADTRFTTPFVVFHQRFSTNTSPRWDLAQPFTLLAHNGEINTVQGNRAWMLARQRDRSSLRLPRVPDVVTADASDSRSLDEAVALMRQAGFGLTHALTRLIPPAWEHDREMPRDEIAFHEFQAACSEPWDGPAAIAFADGRVVGAHLDRNGFRPARYVRTAGGTVGLASEAGVFDFGDDEVVERGRLGPGETIAVDLERGLVHNTAAIRRALVATQPYAQLAARAIARLERPPDSSEPTLDEDLRRRLLTMFGYSTEEIDVVLRPMALEGHEAVGSMGDDTPPAALSGRQLHLPEFFRQRFAQVTNPPIDPLRERIVMSLATLVGRRGSFLDETAADAALVSASSPVFMPEQIAALRRSRLAPVELPIVFAAADGVDGLQHALRELQAQAVAAVRHGSSLLVLTDRSVGDALAPIPALLAVAAIHRALVDAGCRMRASLAVETGEARDAHQLATLYAFGASAVCPYLGLDIAATVDAEHGRGRYRRALEDGLLKVLSKMGVSTFAGYCGGQLFEVIGLSRDLVDAYFPGTPVPLAGRVTLAELTQHVLRRHADACAGRSGPAHPGVHGYRAGGEYHANNPAVVRHLHRASRGGADAEAYAHFTSLVHSRPPAAVRDLLAFRSAGACPLADVEPADAICRRFFASAMSVGALSPEAHRTIAIAMNRLGARSNSGEGGEEPDRFHRPARGGDWNGSATKQLASARFGVTPAYLMSADEIQIKIAQGSKPGEGGQLPAVKVVEHIARLRHAQPGITLISPPVHHDIYSIEDLSQLIHDLRTFHPAARINVKLVAQSGIGVVAAGVVKAGADAIQVSGHDGGTGASPRASIKHVGSPWEVGLVDAHRTLLAHGLRPRVVLQVDGGLKTGRDIAVAAALGADEFGFGTAALLAVGCVMARQCHLNTCPAGIATQRPDLRARFTGTPEMLIAYLRMVAEDVRTMLASLGLRRVDELIGRADLLAPREGVDARLDVETLITTSAPGVAQGTSAVTRPHRSVDATHGVLPEVGTTRVTIAGTVTNVDRAVGARLAGALVGRPGAALQPQAVRLRLRGSAGQSLGAFCMPGMSLHIAGEANDFLGKSMHGGEIVVRPAGRHRGRRDVLVGNTALYGATGGRVFIAGRAGERFGVRCSGATAVVEGIGDHGCEYMTGGLVVVLGPIGRNFGAGMSGGIAFIWDPQDRAGVRCNLEMTTLGRVSAEDRATLTELLSSHHRLTRSPIARDLLRRGADALDEFRKVEPMRASSAMRNAVELQVPAEEGAVTVAPASIAPAPAAAPA